MGNYYYSSPLLSYTSTPVAVTPASESNLTNIISGVVSGAFGASITCSNSTVTSGSLSSVYANSITISGVAKNPFGSSAPVASPPISAILDGPSYTLVYTTLPQTLPSLVASTPAVGFRVSSAVAGVTNVPPFNNSGTPYASTAYDNTQSISTLQEAQVANGKFTTKAAQLYSYLNYSTYLYSPTQLNTVDYSSIASTGYRFVTFAWRITPASPILYGSSLVFRLNNTTPITVTNSIAYAGGTPILLFYRFEDVASSAPTNGASMSSGWINGNSTTGTALTSGNYYLPTTHTSAPNWGLNSVTVNGTTSTSFNVGLYPLNITTQEVRLYCRIGLPMAESFNFASVSATLS